MNFEAARDRLGAGLIAAREQVTARWRLALREMGRTAAALDRCAAELVLHAGAALADGMTPDTPWRRCGGFLRIDCRDPEALDVELTLLWQTMSGVVVAAALSAHEAQQAREQLGAQLDAALRGAAAERQAALREAEVHDPALRFGGVKAVFFSNTAPAPETRAA